MTKRGKNDAPQKRRQRLNPVHRRAQLLDCSMQVFARNGIGEARHAEVAALAGMSVASVFNYFPTREALVNAVLDEVARFIHDEVLLPLQRADLPAPEVLRNSAFAFAEAIERHGDIARVWLDWSTSVRAEVWPRYLDFQGRVLTLLMTTTERGRREGSLPAELDSEDAARLLVGAGYMIAQMQLTGCDPVRVRHFIESIIDGFLFRPPAR